jgi:hypothetical protein
MIMFLFVACFAVRLNAQGYGKINGTVTDPSGAVVTGATVTATEVKSGSVFTVKSGADGAYYFNALLPSEYSITVVAKGFETYSQTGIILQTDQQASINIKLTIGSSSITVDVVGDAPQVDTETGTLSQVVDEAHVVELPLNGRNAAQLTTLVAGVVDAHNEGNGVDQGSGKTFPAVQVASSNGTNPQQQNYLLNGGNNVDEMTNSNGPFPQPDALQEFNVQTSNYDASYGQSAGMVVNIVTKSGGEKFHGDAFEFIRNPIFNARSAFAPTLDTLHRHTFGGTIGGPVIVPGFSKGKSTQFFFGYQYRSDHNASTGATTTVPTAAEKAGNLANLCTGTFTAAPGNANNNNPGNFYCSVAAGQIYNPFTGQELANNAIPAAQQDPASQLFQAAFPTATADAGAGKLGGVVNYLKPSTLFYEEYFGRVDHSFGDKDHLFGHYYENYYQANPIFNPTNLASYTSYFNTRYHSALLAETHTFSSNLLNNLIINYQRIVALRGGPPGSQDITAFGVGAGTTPAFWQPTGAGVYMTASVGGYFSEGSSAFASWLRNNYTFNDDLHWVLGKHNIAIGGHFEISKFDVTNIYQSFSGPAFGKATGNGNIANVDAYSNFLTGFMSGFNQGNYELLNDRNHFPGAYVQDSWKVNPRLTLNYGVRWESFAPWANRVGNEQEFITSQYLAGKSSPLYATAAHAAGGAAASSTITGLPAGLMLTGDQGIPQYGVQSKYLQITPRFGFSLDVFGDGKTVVRGGGGIFYQDRMPGFFNLNQAGNVPNTISVSLTNPGLNAANTPGVNQGGPFSNPYCSPNNGAGYTAISAFCAGAGQPYNNPFPFTLPFASTQKFPNNLLVDEYDPTGKFRVPVTDDFNLTIEHQLAPGWAARIAYVGTVSHHQFVNLELNPTVNTLAGGSNIRRVYNTSPNIGPCLSNTEGPVWTAANNQGCDQNYSQIVVASMTGNSHFNSVQGSLEKKYSKGLSLLFNYVYSSAFDDMPLSTRVGNQEDLNAGASYVFPIYPTNGTVNMPAGAYAGPANGGFKDYKGLDRGRSDFDHPHVISASYTYEFPKLHNGNEIVKQVVNGWRTSGLVQHHSGEVLTAYAGADESLTGLGQDRAVRDFTQSTYAPGRGIQAITSWGNCAVGKYCRQWLNPAAFSAPVSTAGAAGTGYGNVIKGSLRGPGYTNWDSTLTRTFAVYRSVKVDFRAEYFNVLNHTQLGNPNTTVTSTAFGTITGYNGSYRQGEMALKLIF